jgi:hypothetical protein
MTVTAATTPTRRGLRRHAPRVRCAGCACDPCGRAISTCLRAATADRAQVHARPLSAACASCGTPPLLPPPAAKRPHTEGTQSEAELREEVARLKSQMSILLHSTAALAGAVGQGNGLPAPPPAPLPPPPVDTTVAAMREHSKGGGRREVVCAVSSPHPPPPCHFLPSRSHGPHPRPPSGPSAGAQVAIAHHGRRRWRRQPSQGRRQSCRGGGAGGRVRSHCGQL